MEAAVELMTATSLKTAGLVAAVGIPLLAGGQVQLIKVITVLLETATY
jgi:hypothetical protein